MSDTDNTPDPIVILGSPDANIVLGEFNNLLDARDEAIGKVTMANETLKLAKADLGTVEAAIFAKAREMRQEARELPLFEDPNAHA